MLPRLLAAHADLRSTERRFADANVLLDEAADMLHGLFTSASSPWVQSRLISGMDDVFLARIRLEGARGARAEQMYAAIEEARVQALVPRGASGQSDCRRRAPRAGAGSLRESVAANC